MKKSLKVCQILLLLIIFLCSSLGLNYVYAADIVASGNCGENITWSLDSDGTLTITGSGDMSGEECAWLDYADQVKNVVFNGEITSISANAFARNTNLTNVTIPETVTEINRRAFAECTNLQTVIFPEGLREIGTSAFYNCTSLTSVELGEDLMYIRQDAFANCTALKEITLNSRLVLVDDSEYTLPENLEQINGHKYSGMYYYARQNGINFKDVSTNQEFSGTITNQDYLDKLPTTGVKALGIISNHSTTGNISEDAIDFCNTKDENNETYQAIKAKVEELTANCTTDMEKAEAITKWVRGSKDYGGVTGAPATIETVYYCFNATELKCEGFTTLTNYMLYLCGIPTATAKNLTHQWSAAFVDGEWIYIDATGGIVDGASQTAHEIIYTYNNAAYIIMEPTEENTYAKKLDIPEVECEHLHTTTHQAVASTCLVQGNAEYVTCADCGKVISGSAEKLPLADHSYGELIARVEPTHTSETLAGGVEAHYECSVCGKLFNEDKEEVTEEDLVIPAPEHSYGEDWTNDTDYHWKECGCGNIVEQEAHRGGEATCSEQATCEVCGVKYGNLNPNNHKNTELINEKEATCQEEGYTGDTYCNDCDTVIATGTTIEKTDHRGGEATCVSKAKCEVCGTEYGEIDSTNHKNTETRNAVEATCTTGGYTGDTYCADCDTKLEDGEVIKAEGHKGGEATCVSKAKCEVCGTEYGEIDSTNHKNTELINEKEVTCTEDGYTGDTYCNDCDKVVENGTTITATGHKGGEATCVSKAKCEVCGLEYGEIDSTNHKNTETRNAVEATTETEGYTGDIYCIDCDELVTEGEIIPVITTDPEEPTDDETKPTEPSEDETKPSTDDEKEEVKPVEEEKETTDESKPQTDDNSNMTLWISLLVISGISFVAIARCNTKRKVSKHSK